MLHNKFDFYILWEATWLASFNHWPSWSTNRNMIETCMVFRLSLPNQSTKRENQRREEKKSNKNGELKLGCLYPANFLWNAPVNSPVSVDDITEKDPQRHGKVGNQYENTATYLYKGHGKNVCNLVAASPPLHLRKLISKLHIHILHEGLETPCCCFPSCT